MLASISRLVLAVSIGLAFAIAHYSPANAFSVPVYKSDVSSVEFVKGGGTRGGSVSVKGYTRKNGTYVAPHTRSAPNSSKIDNWSSKGNVNPYNGKVGTKEPTYVPPPPRERSSRD